MYTPLPPLQEVFTPKLVADQVLTLLFAGYDTTSIALA
jgi:cytochrome P450